MKVSQLNPAPEHQTEFAWSHHATVPEKPGCYALVTFSGDILYVGLATASIRSRIGCHLDTPDKRKAGAIGAAFWCYYTVRESAEVGIIERGWMNQAILEDGDIPPLNKLFSPI